MKKSGQAAALAVAGGVAILQACGGSEKKSPEPPPTVAATLAPTPAPVTAPPAITTAPAPTTAAAPSTTLAARPGPAAATPKPAPSAKAAVAPTVGPPPATAPHDHSLRVTAILSSAQAALASGNLKEAGALFDDALALDPDNGQARKGRAFVSTSLLGQTRAFVPDLASSEGAEGRIKKMEGFDDVEESNVRRAVKVPGRAELDSTPVHIKPGDPYKVEIYIKNLSVKKKKDIKISNVSVKRIVNDKEVKVPVDWKGVTVSPKQRALVATVTGNWEDDVSSWVLDVKLLADETNDIYENRLVWK